MIVPVLNCAVRKVSVTFLDGIGINRMLAGRFMTNVGRVSRIEMRMLLEIGRRELRGASEPE